MIIKHHKGGDVNVLKIKTMSIKNHKEGDVNVLQIDNYH